MDRKFCVLLYSNYSKASIDLIAYIKKIPLDFPTMVGLTMICIDNPNFKMILNNNGISYVPTLLVEYYNGTKQKFEKDYIYMWIDQIMASFKKMNDSVPAPEATPDSSDTTPKASEVTSRKTIIDPSVHSSPEGRLSKRPDIASIALEMQKSRDLELAEIKEQQKPV